MNELLAYGPLGIFVIAFMSGLIHPKPTVDRLIAERDRAEQQRDSIVTDVLGKVAPALEKAIEAAKSRDAQDLEIHEVLIDVRRWLERQ